MGLASPTKLGGPAAGLRAKSLCTHAENAAGRWWCPAARMAGEIVSLPHGNWCKCVCQRNCLCSWFLLAGKAGL